MFRAELFRTGCAIFSWFVAPFFQCLRALGWGRARRRSIATVGHLLALRAVDGRSLLFGALIAHQLRLSRAVPLQQRLTLVFDGPRFRSGATIGDEVTASAREIRLRGVHLLSAFVALLGPLRFSVFARLREDFLTAIIDRLGCIAVG